MTNHLVGQLLDETYTTACQMAWDAEFKDLAESCDVTFPRLLTGRAKQILTKPPAIFNDSNKGQKLKMVMAYILAAYMVENNLVPTPNKPESAVLGEPEQPHTDSGGLPGQPR